MNPHDLELLEFARRWEPFGDPSAADILIEFGMTTSRFSERLEELSISAQRANHPIRRRRTHSFQGADKRPTGSIPDSRHFRNTV